MYDINPVPVVCKNCKLIYSLGNYHQCPSCECVGYDKLSLETLGERPVEKVDFQHREKFEPKPEHVWMEEQQEEQSAWDLQTGGNHYKNMRIQPAKYIQDNEMDWLSGNIVKYASRHKAKGGRQDVEKIIHYAQLLLEEYDGGQDG